MVHPICVTCGTQFAACEHTPDRCPICADERQYVPASGQQWTTLEQFQKTHENTFTKEEPGLHSIHPRRRAGVACNVRAGIGQRALLVCTNEGNLLWDCVPPLDASTIDAVNALGGLRGIAVSHPHFFTTMVEWSRAFGNAPIYLHARCAKWVMRPDDAISHWDGESKPLFGGLTLINTGGHFAGSQVLHWADGAGGKGTLLTADEPFVCSDQQWVSFMRSFPNLVPLGPKAIRRIVARLEPVAFEKLYGAFPNQTVATDAKNAVMRSAQRYLHMIES